MTDLNVPLYAVRNNQQHIDKSYYTGSIKINVGSTVEENPQTIYLSLNDVNPSTYFGGTWVLIKDRFLIGAGNSYKAGTIGGSQNHRHDFKIGHRMNYYEIMCDNYDNKGLLSELLMMENSDKRPFLCL